MTSPDLYQPNQPGRLEDIKPTISGLANIMLSNVGTIAQNIFRGIADAVAGLFKGQDGALGEISDRQIALADRYDLLEGVRGYCCAYQSKNINLAWNGTGNKRILPFNGRLGPAKGAHISGDGIVFDEVGLWLIFANARARETGSLISGADEISLYVDVFNPDGSMYSPMIYDGFYGTHFGSIGGAFPVVIDTPGQFVRVSCWSGKWRWWDGGARYSRLAVVKQDSRTIDKPATDVPDETENG